VAGQKINGYNMHCRKGVKMSWIKVGLVVLVVIVLAAIGGYFGYDAAYSAGETEGVSIGFRTGKQEGYTSGVQDGYDEGYTLGQQSGYNEGYDEGYDEGYSVGEDEGYETGYSAGETQGYTSGRNDGHASGYDEGVASALGHGYTLRDPTYAEVLSFLDEDRTDENEYIEDTYGVYVCSHFARDAGNNAELEGFRCAFVEIRFIDTGHAIIAFNTVDRGLLYFDPITDERVIPEIGKRYYQCVIPDPGHYYEEPSIDDTIMDVLVIW
jgi:hypothetical protein